MPVLDNVHAIQERLTKAVQRAGRAPEDVVLLAVTKFVPPERVREACSGGIRHVGENRVQEAEQKRSSLASAPEADNLTWHLIGHLQSNKAKKAASLFDSIQSLDSLPLAEKLNAESAALGKVLSCLVEIKVSEEPSKFGLPPAELAGFLAQTSRLSNLSIEGLMTIAPYFDDAEKSRPYFKKVRKLFEAHSSQFKGRKVLSMGMSHDFEVAVEEGSTLVRIGTAIFGPRPKNP